MLDHQRRVLTTAARDRAIPIGIAHYLADHIPNAELRLLDTDDPLIWFSEAIDEITDAVQEFLDRVGDRLSTASEDRSLNL